MSYPELTYKFCTASKFKEIAKNHQSRNVEDHNKRAEFEARQTVERIKFELDLAENSTVADLRDAVISKVRDA